MPNINNIEIDKNSICYGDEVLKISNISRMCIFRFKNLKREEHEREKQRYKDSKRYYEQREHNKKKIVIGIFSVCLLERTLWGLIVLAISIICGLLAIKTYRKKIDYNEEPPEEKSFPEKFGLGIQMNSGYYAVFAAEGTERKRCLAKTSRGY